jgi:hypothetical protein
MTRKTIVVSTILFAGGLVAIPVIAAQKKPSPTTQDRQSEQHSLAVNIVRAINTAEANYKQKHGTYATWDMLVSDGDFTDHGTKWAPESMPTVAHAMYGNGPEIVPGWKLRLLLTKDSNTYVVFLEDANDAKCSYAVISNERGLIRESRPLGCS